MRLVEWSAQKIQRAMITLILLGSCVLAPAAYADVTMDLGTLFPSNPSPAGTGPWLQATFSQNTANSVNLTMSATGLTGANFASNWYFNFMGPGNPATDLTATLTSGGPTPNNYIAGLVNPTMFNTNSFKADGAGFFDIVFEFPTPNSGPRFGPGSTATFLIADSANNISPNDFVGLSTPSPNGQYLTAAHIQGLGEATSSWIGATTTTAPEPSTYAILAGCIACILLIQHRQMARSHRKI